MIDTDSCFINIGQYLIDKGVRKQFDVLDQKSQVEYVERISRIIAKHINKQSVDITQKLHYNSQVTDFGITFEPEKVALTALFACKKRYASWVLSNGGLWRDKLAITGLDVIRSDSPEIVKPKILEILTMILKKHSDSEIRDIISKFKIELQQATPEEIAENKGINQLEKYLLPNYEWKLKTPHQIKGVANFNFLLDKFNLRDKYDSPQEGVKAKIVYLMPNKFGKESLSFYKWPIEFDKIGIHVDKVKMIENNFTKKIRGLLEAINKTELLEMESLF